MFIALCRLLRLPLSLWAYSLRKLQAPVTHPSHSPLHSLLHKAGAQMCLQFGGLMENAFISPDLCDMNKVVLNLYTGITWGLLTTTDAQILLLEVPM